jgi:hypothetical protein
VISKPKSPPPDPLPQLFLSERWSTAIVIELNWTDTAKGYNAGLFFWIDENDSHQHLPFTGTLTAFALVAGLTLRYSCDIIFIPFDNVS